VGCVIGSFLTRRIKANPTEEPHVNAVVGALEDGAWSAGFLSHAYEP